MVNRHHNKFNFVRTDFTAVTIVTKKYPRTFRIGDSEKEISIFYPKNETWLGSSSQKIIDFLKTKKPLEQLRVKQTTLDAFVVDDYDRPLLIKIDVEGYEPQVLYGADTILTNFTPPIVFEYQPYLYKSHYKNILSLLIEQYGYSLYHLEAKNKAIIRAEDIVQLTNNLIEERSLINVLAIKD